MTRYYIDACIWRDYLENRSDNFRPLGEWALELIKKAIRSEEMILCSELVKDELREDLKEEEINDAFSIVPPNLFLTVKISRKQIIETKEKSLVMRTPFKDTLHAVIARDNDAIMVTRDKHFLELLDIAKIRKPEDLL